MERVKPAALGFVVKRPRTRHCRAGGIIGNGQILSTRVVCPLATRHDGPMRFVANPRQATLQPPQSAVAHSTAEFSLSATSLELKSRCRRRFVLSRFLWPAPFAWAC